MIEYINEHMVSSFIMGVILLSIGLMITKKPITDKKDIHNNIEERHKEIDRLDALLDAKYKELIELNAQIENHQFDKMVSLTKLEVKALDVYEQSGIRIPSDIIEDLHAMRLNSVNEMVDYIEIQRSYWKLENTKKAFRRVEAK